MIIEKDPKIAQSLEKMAIIKKIPSISTSFESEAIDICRKKSISGIIFDPALIKSDKYIFLVTIRKLPHPPKSVIAIPSHIVLEEAIELMKLGVTDIIMKDSAFQTKIDSTLGEISQNLQTKEAHFPQIHERIDNSVRSLEQLPIEFLDLNSLVRSEIFSSILESIPTIVHVINTEYQFVMVNNIFRSYCQNIPLNSDVLGKRVQECFPMLKQKVFDEYHQVFVSGENCITTETMNIANHHFLSKTQKFPIKQQGKVIGILTIITDLSEKNRTFDLLQNKESLLDMTQEFTKVGGWLWDPKTEENYWTKETYRIHGLTPPENLIVTASLVKLSLNCYDKRDQEKIYDTFKLSYEKGIPYELVVPFTALDGKRKWVRTKAKPIFDAGEIVAIVGALEDITDAKSKSDIKEELQYFYKEKARILTRITTSDHFRQGNILVLSQMITEEICHLFKIDRGGVWLFDSISGDLINIDTFEKDSRCHTSGEVLSKIDFHNEFELLINSKFVATTSSQTDPSTVNYVEKYLSPKGIISMMDIRINFGEKPLGTLRFEHTQITHGWTENEISFASQLADQLALAIANRDNKRAEDQIHLLAEMLDDAPNSIYVHDAEGNFLYANRSAHEMHGYTKDEFLRRTLFDINEKQNLPQISQRLKSIDSYGDLTVEFNHIREDGSIFPMEIHSKQVSWRDSIAILCVGIDVSERKQFEKQLLQSRKMEAVGQLAAGIAHDFNNILAGILGMAEILKDNENLDSEYVEFIDQMILDTKRGADLTRKLLLFGRKTRRPVINLDVNQIIQDTALILKRSIEKKINIVLELDAKSTQITGNAAQLQTAFLNLGINAGQAIENGGKIFFSTTNVEISSGFQNVSTSKLPPGRYVRISVQDTGSGILPENIPKLFDPFFTTKDPGKGTGLGLSIVYGAIKDHKGQISVESEVGKGTQFQILIPLSKLIVLPSSNNILPERGFGKILLVDDERSIRISGKIILEKLGYTVLLAENGRMALELYKNDFKEIKLVLLDMNMPEMNGVETFLKLRDIRHDCKIIVSSGFLKESDLKYLNENGLFDFIQKPFQGAELGRIVNKAMNTN